MLLAWALQAPELLGPLDRGARVDWALTPSAPAGAARAVRQWGEPVARVIDGELHLAGGRLPARRGLSAAHPRSNGAAAASAGLRGGLLGTVSAQTGAATDLSPARQRRAGGRVGGRRRRRRRAVRRDARGACWRASAVSRRISSGCRRGSSSARPHAGSEASAAARAPTPAELPRADVAWARRHDAARCVVAFERPGERRLSALLVGSHEEDNDVLRLVRLDSADRAARRAAALESRWARFPSYDALSDSIREDGRPPRAGAGAVRPRGTDGVVAYQSHFAGPATGRPALVWVTVATGERQGAGHSIKEAWSNLLGAIGAGASPGQAQATRLDDAPALPPARRLARCAPPTGTRSAAPGTSLRRSARTCPRIRRAR